MANDPPEMLPAQVDPDVEHRIATLSTKAQRGA